MRAGGRPLCQNNSIYYAVRNEDDVPTPALALFRGDQPIAEDFVVPVGQWRFFVLEGLSQGEEIHLRYGAALLPFQTFVFHPEHHCDKVSAVTFTDTCEGVRIGFSVAKYSVYLNVYEIDGEYRRIPARETAVSVTVKPGSLVHVGDRVIFGGAFPVDASVAAHVHARPAKCSGGQLPITGQKPTLAAGVVLVMAGLVALLFGRRRRAPR